MSHASHIPTFTALDLFVAFGKRARIPLEKVIGAASTVSSDPFLDASQFAWVADVEARWQEIRAELDEILDDDRPIPSFQEISVRQTKLTTDNRWRTFFLYGYGFRADGNCARCPIAAEVVAAIPGMRTAFFSVLGPQKRLPPHRGPWKGVLRYHLGLKIPATDGRCGIRVADATRQWTEGQSLVFDDTYEHEAWNLTDEDRVVLFVDVERPLRRPIAQMNRSVLNLIAASPYVQDAKRRFENFDNDRKGTQAA